MSLKNKNKLGQSVEKPRGYSQVNLCPRAVPRELNLARGAAGPEGKIEYSRDRPRAQIHLATPEAFPQIVILFKSRKSCVGFH